MNISEGCIVCMESKYNVSNYLSTLKIPAKVVIHLKRGDVRGLHTMVTSALRQLEGQRTDEASVVRTR